MNYYFIREIKKKTVQYTIKYKLKSFYVIFILKEYNLSIVTYYHRLFRDVSGSSTPRKVTTPTLGTRANKYRRFHSVPRSSTID